MLQLKLYGCLKDTVYANKKNVYLKKMFKCDKKKFSYRYMWLRYASAIFKINFKYLLNLLLSIHFSSN